MNYELSVMSYEFRIKSYELRVMSYEWFWYKRLFPNWASLRRISFIGGFAV